MPNRKTDGSSPPLRVLVRVVDVARTYGRRRALSLIDQGFAKVGKTKTSHPDIVVGVDPSVEISLPSERFVEKLDDLTKTLDKFLKRLSDTWIVTLVSWSLWGRAAVSGNCQPPSSSSPGTTS